MRMILTAQEAATGLAVAEAAPARVERVLAPGVVLCDGARRPQSPIFLRHMCPAAEEVPLSGTVEDVRRLAEALELMLPQIAPEKGAFSVQTRIMEGYPSAYKRYDVNTALAEAAARGGAPLDVKNPAQVLSVTLAEGTGWLGLSGVEENISGFAGGVRRYKREAGQLSRAEFKLLEALEVFGITLEDGERAVDLGAAPGGWTRILRRRGLYVTAVDPAALDGRLARDKRVTHYRATAQAYFRKPREACDWLVNDMKMDSAESAELMAEGAACLRPDGGAIMTLKLPEDSGEWSARVAQAGEILAKAYAVQGMRQLFHNRSEVTAYLRRRG